MKRVVLVHGWGGHPDGGWFPWLKEELEADGISVLIPELPDTDTPHIAAWVEALGETVGTVDTDTHFVGHSLGCQAILRYLERLTGDAQAGGAVFVAGFFLPLNGMETVKEQEIDQEWSGTPIDTEAVRIRIPRSVAIFSDDDPDVPMENAPVFIQRLDSEIQIMHGMQHFSEDTGCVRLPAVLSALLRLME
jgi:uncharacterized protein